MSQNDGVPEHTQLKCFSCSDCTNGHQLTWSVLVVYLAFVIGCQSYSEVVFPEFPQICLSFTSDSAGSLPAGWVISETNGKGTQAVWEVIADKTAADGAKSVAITRTQNAGQTFNMLIYQSQQFRNLDIGVQIKAVSGKEDQGGGLVWRYHDPNNYYIARWNPLENNLRVYVVKDGKRKQLGSADVQVDPVAWHTITVVHQDNHIMAYLDNYNLAVEDDTLSHSGKVGLWTKADAATAFDAISIL